MSPHATGMDPQYQQQQYLIQRNLESPHSTGHDQRHGGSYTSPDQNLYKSTPLQSPQLTGIYQKYQNGIENQYNVGLHGQETQPQPQPQLQFYQPIQSNIQPKISNVEDSSNKSGELFLDLIDEDRRGQLPEKSILESNEINSKIQDAITNTLQEGNSSLRLVYSNQERINSLYNQLSHHHKQAVANNSNLESHMKYLAQQKSAILQLNKELTRIEENNLKEIDLVYINGQTSVQLDSLISPDLALVNQLYDIVSEIKATKDVIDLIGGNFRNEGELIKDSNMETSVRTVRTLAREVFWLEVMKDEIAGIMNLS